MANWQKLIPSDPKGMFRKPVIKNTRITVDLILEKLASGETKEQLLKAYPRITEEAIQGFLYFAAYSVKNEVVYPTINT